MFITIASFRDKLCPVTLFNIFTKAKYPERITVGVVQQNLEEDIDCYEEYCRLILEHRGISTGEGVAPECPFKENIIMHRVSALDAKGPTWGRALGSKLVGDQEFCMQTDSHMDYVPDWDVKIKGMWGLINNEYAVMSTYVTDSGELSKHIDQPHAPATGINHLHEVPHL